MVLNEHRGLAFFFRRILGLKTEPPQFGLHRPAWNSEAELSVQADPEVWKNVGMSKTARAHRPKLLERLRRGPGGQPPVVPLYLTLATLLALEKFSELFFGDAGPSDTMTILTKHHHLLHEGHRFFKNETDLQRRAVRHLDVIPIVKIVDRHFPIALYTVFVNAIETFDVALTCQRIDAEPPHPAKIIFKGRRIRIEGCKNKTAVAIDLGGRGQPPGLLVDLIAVVSLFSRHADQPAVEVVIPAMVRAEKALRRAELGTTYRIRGADNC